MRIVTGAGEFETKIERIVKEHGNIVMIGKMGYWEAKLILNPKEAMNLAKQMILPLIQTLVKH